MNPMALPAEIQGLDDLSQLNQDPCLLIYFADDEGAGFRERVQGLDPELAERFAAEPELAALKGGVDRNAWFQTSRRTYLVVSGGPSERRDALAIRRLTEKSARGLLDRAGRGVGLVLDAGTPAEIELAAEAALVALYQFNSLKADRKERDPLTLRLQGLPAEGASRAQAFARATACARELGNLPANYATPAGVVERVRAWAEGLPLEIEAWDRSACEAKGLGAFLGVARGSENEPYLLTLRYRPDGATEGPTLGLVGKGVTFDTGGYNLKVQPYKDVLDMKGDMLGAAATIGALLGVAQTRPNTAVIGVCALTDNMINGFALHPGDVVTHCSGKTIEVQNTDAEGRLVLSDALTVAQEAGATHLVDIATLTGACAVALGNHYTGLMTNNAAWGDFIAGICNANGEPVWPLPLDYRYRDELRSDVADLSNLGKGRVAGAQIAGTFLQEFVTDDRPWVHMDIAGTMHNPDINGHHGTARYAGVMASSLARLSLAPNLFAEG